jgi:hypothetical protein
MGFQLEMLCMVPQGLKSEVKVNVDFRKVIGNTPELVQIHF